MLDVVVFPSVLGMRPGVHAAADRLAVAGFRPLVVDVYDGGLVFDDYDEAMAHMQALGYDTVLTRARRAIDELDSDRFVTVGFSAGVVPAQIIAATDPRAVGCVALSSVISVAALELDEGWPDGVPLQFHTMDADPWLEPDQVEAIQAELGEQVQVFSYPGTGHLFADPSLPAEYDAGAADLMWSRVEEFIRAVDEG
jgi:dienelactone hydrolase